eukprot:7164913-Pyramimonas_sp.AAC.1
MVLKINAWHNTAWRGDAPKWGELPRRGQGERERERSEGNEPGPGRMKTQGLHTYRHAYRHRKALHRY